MNHLVFVYGTLKADHYNHRALSMGKAKLLSDDARILGKMYDLGPYPAVVQGGGQIVGEVYEVDQTTLDRLDHLEGHPSFYRRESVNAFTIKGDPLPEQKVWAYFLNKERLPKNAVPMPVGNWPIKR